MTKDEQKNKVRAAIDDATSIMVQNYAGLADYAEYIHSPLMAEIVRYFLEDTDEKQVLHG